MTRLNDRPLLAVLAGFAFVAVIIGVGLLTQPRVPANVFDQMEPGRCFVDIIRDPQFDASELGDRLDALPTYLPDDFMFVTGAAGSGSTTGYWAGSDCRQVRITVGDGSLEGVGEGWTLMENAEGGCSLPDLGTVDCITWARSTDGGSVSVRALGPSVEETERIARSIQID